MTGDDIWIELGGWDALREVATPIRFQVFVREQNVPAEIELDDWDARSLHAIARETNGAAVGTGRLLPDGHIGRMAVLATARGLGVGAALLRALMDAARSRGMTTVELSAQTHAVPFYRREGFAEFGDEYMDAGIPHRNMRRRL
jgi:predicted GNAT family N-acyltransferase